jgi:hypothetical protein
MNATRFSPLARSFARPRVVLSAVSSVAGALLLTVSGCSGSGSSTTTKAARIAVTLTWATPAPLTYSAGLILQAPSSAAPCATGMQLDAVASATGFSCLPGSYVYTPAAGTTLTVGSHTLSVTFTPTDTVDYAPATASVVLVVSQATPVITWPTPPPIASSTPLSSFELDATANTPGTFVYTPAAGTTLSAGTHSLSVSFTPTDSVDYTSASATVSQVVNTSTPNYTFGNVDIVGGGYVTGIIAHPTAANVRYARTDVGGCYRWNPTTSTWIPLLDFESGANFFDMGCAAIALDPTNAQNLYLAVGMYSESYGTNGQILISNNQGATFTTVNLPFKNGSNDNGRDAGERLDLDPNLPSKLYLGTINNGLWVSTNSGSSWSQVTSFPVTGPTIGAGINFIDYVTTSATSGTATPVIYVGVSDTGTSTTGYSALYRSTNGGSTWQVVPGQPTGLMAAHGVIGPDGALYLAFNNAIGPAGITAGALWKYTLPANTSPTGAGTWTNITPGTSARNAASQGGFGTITVDPEQAGVLMATTIDDYNYGDDIYRSLNYGASWVSLKNQGATFSTTASPWLLFGSTSPEGVGNWPASLIIDPVNSSHVVYATGQTVWDSANINLSDTGGKAAFNVAAQGIEECVVQSLMSPTVGPLVVSGVDDLGGFVHTSVTASPTGGMIMNPILGTGTGLDFAQALPATMARVGSGTSPAFGSYSTNSGTAWTQFKTVPAGTTAGQGSIAVSYDGVSLTTMVWAPSDAPVAYSTNNGTTWTASTGATAESGVIADRVNSKKFYIFVNGTLQISTNSGVSFTTAATGLPTGGTLTASFAAEGDLWLTATNGLYHSTNSGTTFTLVTGFSQTSLVTFGKASTGAVYPAIYVNGVGSNGYGFYRSIDGGLTWYQINDSNHQWGYILTMAGDPKTYGRIYIGTGGRGVIYGDSPY